MSTQAPKVGSDPELGSPSTRNESRDVGSAKSEGKDSNERTEPVNDAAAGNRQLKLFQAVGGCLLYANTSGLITSFGVYQSFYSRVLIPHEPQSRIAWIGSSLAAIMFFVGFLTGPLFDAGYLRSMLVTGVLLTCFGLMMTSLCNEYYQLLLAQGFVTGIGSGLLLVPAMTVPAAWYPTLKGRAIVFMATGVATSLGGLLYSVMFHYIERDAGWRWAIRAVAFVILGTSAPAVAMLRYPASIPQRRKLIDWSMWNEPTYRCMVVGGVLGWSTLLTPINWIEAYYVAEVGLRNKDLLFWLVPIALVGGIPGRILLNGAAIKLGPTNLIIFTTFMCGVLNFCWMAVHSEAEIIGFAFVYGFFALGWTALVVPTILGVAPNENNIGTRIGMATGATGLGLLAGLPLCGQILWSTGSYTGMQALAGGVLLLSATILVYMRYLEVGLTTAKI